MLCVYKLNHVNNDLAKHWVSLKRMRFGILSTQQNRKSPTLEKHEIVRAVMSEQPGGGGTPPPPRKWGLYIWGRGGMGEA